MPKHNSNDVSINRIQTSEPGNAPMERDVLWDFKRLNRKNQREFQGLILPPAFGIKHVYIGDNDRDLHNVCRNK